MANKQMTAAETKRLTAELHRFVVESADLRALEKELKRFNIFDVLKSKTNELRHSNILAWLMDPKANHGLGDLYLRRWLVAVCNNANRNEQEVALDPVEVDTTPFKTVKVFREWNHIDILLEIRTADNEQWVIAIENKVRSRQGADQLALYRGKVDKSFGDAHKRVYLFLTMQDEEPLDGQFVATNYEAVHTALTICLDEMRESMAAGPVSLVEHYMNILQEQFMKKTATVELAHRIYWAHREALDYLFDHRPDVLDEASELFWSRLEKDGPANGLVPKGYKKGEVSFLPQAWDVASNQGTEWPKVWCFMKFVNLDDMTLRAIIGDEVTDTSWREGVREAAVEGEWNPSSKKTSYTKWFTFYIKPLGAFPREESDPRAIADGLWSTLVAAIGSDAFKKMTAEMTTRIGQL